MRFWYWYGVVTASYMAAWCFAGMLAQDFETVWVSFFTSACCMTMTVR